MFFFGSRESRGPGKVLRRKPPTVRAKADRSATRIKTRVSTAGKAAGATTTATIVPAAMEVRDKVAGVVSTSVTPTVTAAVDRAKHVAVDTAHTARDDVAPKVAAAVTAALAAAEPVRDEARARGSAALHALRGDVVQVRPAKSRGRKVRRFGLLAAVLGAAFAGWKAWSSANAKDPWELPAPVDEPASGPAFTAATTGADASLHTSPYAAPGPEDSDGLLVTDDVAAASPDEALADAAAEDPAELAAGSEAPETPDIPPVADEDPVASEDPFTAEDGKDRPYSS